MIVYLGLRHQPSDPELQELGNVVEDRAQGDRDNVAFPHGHAVTELKKEKVEGMDFMWEKICLHYTF